MTVEDLLRSLSKHRDVTVTIASGLEHWRHGETTVAVRGDGSVAVRHRRRGREEGFDGSLDASAVAELGAALADLEREPPPPAGEREPDDVAVAISVSRDGESLVERRIWYGDRFDHQGVDRLLRRYESIASEVSGGSLPYGEGRSAG